MNILYRPRFKENLLEFPRSIQEKFYKQAEFLLRDIRYPSLCAKKFDESKDIWQARVDASVRFYFLIHNDIYILLDIKKHPK